MGGWQHGGGAAVSQDRLCSASQPLSKALRCCLGFRTASTASFALAGGHTPPHIPPQAQPSHLTCEVEVGVVPLPLRHLGNLLAQGQALEEVLGHPRAPGAGRVGGREGKGQ